MENFSILPQPYEGWFMTFFFVYARVSATIITMPILGGRSVPNPIKAGLAFWVAVVIVGPHWGITEITGASIPGVDRVYNGILDFALAAVSEVVIGISFGFIAQLFIYALGLSGEIIGQQAGFSAASVFDPITGQDNFLVAQIKIWFATIVFIIIGGPEAVLEILHYSFQMIKPGEGVSIAQFGDAGFYTILNDEGRRYALMSIFYRMGIQIAIPMIATMVMVSLAEAFIARTAPQMNILSVGFAVRISISLFFLGYLIHHIVVALKHYLGQYQTYAAAFLERLVLY